MLIGILTGGGDSPATNAVIRAVVRRAQAGGHQVFGFEQGWLGVMDNLGGLLSPDDVAGLLPRGGTILGTSRTNPVTEENGIAKVKQTLAARGIDGLISIGGDDTNGISQRLSQEGVVRCIGVPQTIDNDIPGTEFSVGFDTALNIVMEALDRLHTTATSHHRVMICEIMGRESGWLALLGGLAGGADDILIPEAAFSLDDVCERLKQRWAEGKSCSIVAIAEGAKPEMLDEPVQQDESVDAFGHVRLGGIAKFLSEEITKRTGFETRTSVLGYLQRGGAPTAFDRVLATMFGVKAVDLLEQGGDGAMVVWRAGAVCALPFEEALHAPRTVPSELIQMAELFN
ncbi:6-phosphofructokinase [bacterium]|nr:6-phosphofructokinase [bacterium]